MSSANFDGTARDIDELLSTRTIRDRARKIYDLALRGRTHFSVHLDKLDPVAKLVASVTLKNYPALEIPFHSRWGHFQAEGVDRLAFINEKLKGLSPEERVKSKLDLAVVSVLLDAGAGEAWKFFEDSSGKTIGRSEGLAVASLHMFLRGEFSSLPFRADAEGLMGLTSETLKRAFQVTEKNPLVGVEGRLNLMHALGGALKSAPEVFPTGRPGDLVAHLSKQSHKGQLRAAQVLTAIQKNFGSIWPGRVSINNFNLGDVWRYPALGDGLASLVPFHKLSQWLTYSLVGPLEEAGLKVGHFEELTGLAEYRNGGLLLDAGLIRLVNEADGFVAHPPGSELVVEWRALTVALLEPVAAATRKILGRSEEELPLGKILEGGTWWAGRKIAAEKRADGGPPLKIKSDGTVF